MTSLVVATWRISGWARRVVDGQRALVHEASRAKAHLSKLTGAIQDLSRRIEDGEKQDARLEGKIEQGQQTQVRLIAAIQQATGSLDALWRTLHALFPEKVPKRSSDRG